MQNDSILPGVSWAAEAYQSWIGDCLVSGRFGAAEGCCESAAFDCTGGVFVMAAMIDKTGPTRQSR
ncbi:hypothetical protein RE6C_00164 [Rhodopirellula europaea 6C]|uniref:Uncharacterized protein n=1 Tax=Rhodopirellula europaea 6C TaxID=1263867 RepID=M2A9W1_9BACT|nr:hypothetical protein RE6C_00164 [Rhodopirellula europaea 6C]